MAGATEPKPDDTAQTLDDLEELLKRIPGAKRVIGEIQELRAMMVERRPPRIAVVGRRGSGKSSLVNALMGHEVAAVGAVEDTTRAPQWIDLTVNGRTLRWLDTPGLRAGAEPARRAEVMAALRVEAPDVLLFTVKATQVDAGIDDDLADLRALVDGLATGGAKSPPVIAVVTKVDELPPLGVKAPPYDRDAAKRENVAKAVETLRGHLTRHKFENRPVVPVGTWQRFRDRERVTDWRWNLETLGAEVFAALPRNAQVEAVRAFERAQQLRRKVAMRLVGTATSVSVVVGATPLPVADLALLLPLQSAMLTGVVYVSGRALGPRAITEWMGLLGINVGAGIGLREAVRAMLKLVPGIGATISGAVAGTGTWALGLAAVRYFIDGQSPEASRAVFERALRDGAPSDPGAEGPPDPDE